MTGRVTDAMMTRTLLRDLEALKGGISRTQLRASSGKEITRPSDDPYGTGRAIGLRSELEASRQYARNIREATAWQDVTDAALGRLTDVVQRARELIVRGASDTASAEVRRTLATEIDQLIASAKEQAGATYDGRYVLSGRASSTRPYVDADDVYRGDTGAMAREIGPGTSIRVNQVASDVMGNGVAANDDLLLHVLRDVSARLQSGSTADMDALRAGDIGRLDRVAENLTRIRANVGVTTNRLDAAATRIEHLEEATTKLLSDVEDADMAETFITLNSQRSAYEAALRSGAQIIQPSLLDFLR